MERRVISLHHINMYVRFQQRFQQTLTKERNSLSALLLITYDVIKCSKRQVDDGDDVTNLHKVS